MASCNKFANTVHAMYLTLMVALGGTLVGVGIYALVRESGFGLQFDSGFWSAVANTGTISIVAGSVLLVHSAIGFFLLCVGDCCGMCLKVFYYVLLFLVTALLVVVGVFSIFLSQGASAPSFVVDAFHDAWRATVQGSSSAACSIQRTYNCTGFNDNTDCQAQPQECPSGCSGANESSDGCFAAILDDYEQWFLPIAIVSLVSAGLSVLDAIVVCYAGPSRRRSRKGEFSYGSNRV